MNRLRVAFLVALCLTSRIASAQPPVGGCRLSTPNGLIAIGATLYYCSADNVWTQIPTGGGTLPSGFIGLVLSGTCPAGTSEVSALNGKTIVGTLAANGDVGTAFGSDSITPAGSNSVPTFTGNSVASSLVSAGTPAGTNSSGTVTPLGTIAWPIGVPTFTGSALATHAHELPMQLVSNVLTRFIASATFGTGTSRAAVGQVTVTANTTAGVVALSEAKSAGTPAGTIAYPAGVPSFTGSSSVTSAEVFTGSALGTHSHNTTATGTVSAPVFSGTAFDNRSSGLKGIFCAVN